MASTKSKTKTYTLKGVAAAPGLACAPALVWKKEALQIPRHSGKDPEVEQKRLERAIRSAGAEIEALSKRLTEQGLAEEAALFDAHLLLMNDRALHKKIRQALEEGIDAEAAWVDSIDQFARQLESLSDETLALRAADLRDIGERVVRILMGKNRDAINTIQKPSIIVAQDLTPSETAAMDKTRTLGFCTAEGGPTSHTAILAKALGIPAIVSLGQEILDLQDDTLILIDGNSGEVIVAPDEATRAEFEKRLEQETEKSQEQLKGAHLPAVTRDGHTVEVVANIGGVDDAVKALEYSAEGVGLLRTEFIFLKRKTEPGEEEQLSSYKNILKIMGKRPVVVRTIDVGGDKEIPYLDLGKESNPFLGWRAIRLCLARPDFFKTQLRALLRASPGHDLRIMFPMIATLQEVRQARELLDEARREVESKGQPIADQIQVGIMIEIPSAVVLANQFAREVDFFSIGTNDLTQYTLAADRTNPKVSHLSDHCHPAIVRQIQSTTEAAHRAGIWVGVCGEMAGDPDAIPILLGIGVDELSMSPALIPQAKSLIRKWEHRKARALVDEVVKLESAEAVRRQVQRIQNLLPPLEQRTP